MIRSLPKASVRASRLQRSLTGVLLASLLVLAVAPAASAATSTFAWLAKVGSSGANGTVAINTYTSGSGAMVLKVKKLPASRMLPVVLLKASCKGASLATLASIKTNSSGALTKTVSLTTSQATASKKQATGTGTPWARKCASTNSCVDASRTSSTVASWTKSSSRESTRGWCACISWPIA